MQKNSRVRPIIRIGYRRSAKFYNIGYRRVQITDNRLNDRLTKLIQTTISDWHTQWYSDRPLTCCDLVQAVLVSDNRQLPLPLVVVPCRCAIPSI